MIMERLLLSPDEVAEVQDGGGNPTGGEGVDGALLR
jgi:hypothetical protein